MRRVRFPIDSDMLELLVAFEEAGSLQKLARMMSRDPSVVSRGLTRLGESGHLLAKKNRKWELTAAGRRLIKTTRAYVKSVQDIVDLRDDGSPRLPANACLMLVNVQQALQSPSLGKSSNPAAVKNIRKVLETWRSHEWPVVHARHVSDRAKSVFFRDAASSGFLPGLGPEKGEWVIEKRHASAFVETDLAKTLDKAGISTVVIGGFTAHECIDATAKHAAALGLNVWVLDDGIAQYELTSPSGKVFSANDVHEIVVSGLSSVATLASTRLVVGLAEP